MSLSDSPWFALAKNDLENSLSEIIFWATKTLPGELKTRLLAELFLSGQTNEFASVQVYRERRYDEHKIRVDLVFEFMTYDDELTTLFVEHKVKSLLSRDQIAKYASLTSDHASAELVLLCPYSVAIPELTLPRCDYNAVATFLRNAAIDSPYRTALDQIADMFQAIQSELERVWARIDNRWLSWANGLDAECHPDFRSTASKLTAAWLANAVQARLHRIPGWTVTATLQNGRPSVHIATTSQALPSTVFGIQIEADEFRLFVQNAGAQDYYKTWKAVGTKHSDFPPTHTAVQSPTGQLIQRWLLPDETWRQEHDERVFYRKYNAPHGSAFVYRFKKLSTYFAYGCPTGEALEAILDELEGHIQRANQLRQELPL